jgi:gluconolactonase
MAPGTAGSVERVAEGFRQTDGPVWFPDGYLLFSDTPANTIYKWTPDGSVKPHRRLCHEADAPAGCSGMTRDTAGRLVICERAGARVTRFEKDGSVTVLADYFEGRRLNSPRDVVCRADGSLYFTDGPRSRVQNPDGDRDELPFNGVFRIVEGRRLQLLVADLSRPGGLAFSPGQKFLYVANSDRNRMVWMRYEVEPDGILSDGKVFYDASRETEYGLPDGLKVDRAGNLFATGPGGIWILSPAGDHLGTVRVPEQPSNLQWAGDGTDLYITARTSIYRMRWPIGGSVL